MEVFIAYRQDDDFSLLKRTLEAWERCENAEPVMVEVDHPNYEIARRVVADGLAEGRHYILVDLGRVPEHADAVNRIEAKLAADSPESCFLSDGVWLYRKGTIQRYAKQTPEPKESWDVTTFRQLQAC